MIHIDGSIGYGGGHLLRTALGLSLVTGKAFHMDKIRANRENPGLKRRHLTAIEAAAAVCGAMAEGIELRSQELVFRPGLVRPGRYEFAAGMAGSAVLVLQTVLPGLLAAGSPSTVTVKGGTHSPYAPSYDFLERVYFRVLNKLGPVIRSRLHAYGFYPAGAGEFTVDITPLRTVRKLSGFDLLDRGKITRIDCWGIVSGMPAAIAREEIEIVAAHLPLAQKRCDEVLSAGPGNVLMIEVETVNTVELFTGFGGEGIPGRKVARDTIKSVKKYISSGVPVGRFLADQLLIPLAMAGKGSFRTLEPTQRTQAVIEIIKQFMDIEIKVRQCGEDTWKIYLAPGKAPAPVSPP